MPTTGMRTLRLDLQWRAQRAPALRRGKSVDGPCLKAGVGDAVADHSGDHSTVSIYSKNLITAFVVAFAAVTASELLTRIWEYF